MKSVFLIYILIACIKMSDSKFLDMLQPEELGKMLKTGQEQYHIMQKNIKTSKFGDCWKAAMSHLEDECKSLNDDSQQDLALRFTNCFLEMSGYPEYSCIGDKKPNLRRICINSMSDRAFFVYTEFYTHTQNMCYYLYSKMWGEQTEETINSLNANSRFVNEQLKVAGKLQNTLLEKQKEGLSVQTTLLEHGLQVTQSLDNFNTHIRSITENLTAANKKQTTVLFELLERLNSLQSWAMGEVNYFSYALYYMCCIAAVFLLTATSRTADARFPLLIALTTAAVIERFIIAYLLKSKIAAESVQDNIYWWSTFVRNASLVICFVLILMYSIKYKNYKIVNYYLLLKLQDQNEAIIRTLNDFNCRGPNDIAVLSTSKQCFTEICEDKNHSRRQSSVADISKTIITNVDKFGSESRPRIHGMLTRTQSKNTPASYDANKYNDESWGSFVTSTPLKPQKLRTRKMNKDRFHNI